MSEPFIGEIRLFAGNFAPSSWAFCDGQLLAVSQNDALFSLLGTIYGGDGRTTFGLPDLRGRVPIHMGTGPGLTPKSIGQKSGLETVTITANQMPSHTHDITAQGQSASGESSDGSNKTWAGTARVAMYGNQANANMRSDALSVTMQNAGGSQAHNNVQPFLCIHYIIALFGIFPSRN